MSEPSNNKPRLVKDSIAAEKQPRPTLPINKASTLGKPAINSKCAKTMSSVVQPNAEHHALPNHSVPIIKPMADGASRAWV